VRLLPEPDPGRGPPRVRVRALRVGGLLRRCAGAAPDAHVGRSAGDAEGGDEFRGPHRGHAYLDELEDEAGRYEVGHCLERIEVETGSRPRTFSYPAGRTCRSALGWFEAAGIELAMTTVTGTNRATGDRYLMRRLDGGYLCVEDRFIATHARLELSGALNWAARFRIYREGS